MTTKLFDGFCATGNSLEARFESGGKFKPVLGGNIEPFQNWWSSCVNGAAFVVSDDFTSPVDQFNVVNESEIRLKLPGDKAAYGQAQ